MHFFRWEGSAFLIFAFLPDKLADRPDLVADLGLREARVCSEEDGGKTKPET